MPRRILIADDDRVFAELSAARLRARGFSVLMAFDAPTAMMTAVKNELDLILLDIRMPGGSGIETLKRLKASARTEPIPVVVVTATDDPSARDQSLAAGAVGFLHKPLEADQLHDEVCRVLGVEPGPAPPRTYP